MDARLFSATLDRVKRTGAPRRSNEAETASSTLTTSGLALTPPQMPVAQTPSALAHAGDGPSYLDFAHWGQ